jgi:hypothetical protein
VLPAVEALAAAAAAAAAGAHTAAGSAPCASDDARLQQLLASAGFVPLPQQEGCSPGDQPE